jgi:hypothetical protein
MRTAIQLCPGKQFVDRNQMERLRLPTQEKANDQNFSMSGARMPGFDLHQSNPAPLRYKDVKSNTSSCHCHKFVPP